MEYIEKIFKKRGWLSILESIVFAILGLILIWHPEETVRVISYIIGIAFIALGIYKVFNYISSKGKYDFYNYDFLYGLMAIIIGIVIIAYSWAIGSVFRIVIGIWIIYSSFMRIGLAMKLKNQGFSVWVYSLILALAMLILGLVITLNQGAIIQTIGVLMIISSVIDIAEDIIFMRNVKEIF